MPVGSHKIDSRMRKVGFKVRLNLLITAAFAAGILAGGLFAIRNYRRAVSAETDASAQLVMGLLGTAQGFISSLSEADQFRDRLVHEIPALTQLRHVRLEVFDKNGKALISSPHRPPDIANRAPRWFADLVSPKAQTYRIPLREGFGTSGEIVVSTDPHDEVDEEWTNTRDMIAVVGGFLLSLWILVLAYVTFALRPMDELHRALQAFGRDQSVRARVFGSSELSRISHQFNELADALETAGRENRNLNQRLMNLRDEERRAIARELHDNLAQYLFAIRTDAFAIEQTAAGASARTIGDPARSISDNAARMEAVVREMIQQLRPVVLDELGLTDALHDMVATWRMRNPRIACDLQIHLPPFRTAEESELAAYHVVQESLTNVAKHSGASLATVTIRTVTSNETASDFVCDQILDVTVEDNGLGVSSLAAANGLGLVGMRERVETLGGKLETVYRAGRGWRVTARLPLSAEKSVTAA